MRILSIRLAGFLSYGRAQFIDFSDANVFCISGPNGAGKSSILDGIVYALYGKIPRYAGRRINTEEDIINHRSNELSISLKFKVQDKVYLVKRELIRGKSAQANIYEIEKGGSAIPLGAKSNREVNAIIEGILGMDYETFTRTIILPQNQIDRFLKPPSSEALSERRQVLQRLLGLEIYREMKRLASQRYRDIAKEIQLIDSRLTGDLSIYTREYTREIERKLREKENYLKSLEEKRMSLVQDIDRLRDDLNLLAGFISTTESLNSVSKRLDALKIEVEKVERLEAILQLQRDALPWKTIVKEIQEKNDRNSSLEKEKRLLTEEIEKFKRSLSLEEENREKYEGFISLSEKLIELVPISQDVREIERERTRLEQLKKEIDKKEDDIALLRKDIEEIENLLVSYDLQIDRLREKKKNKLIEWKDIEEIIDRVRVLKTKEKEIEEYQDKKTELEGRKKTLEEELLRNKPGLEELDRELSLLEGIMDEYQVQRIVSNLSIGDRCPVCGNVIEELPRIETSRTGSYEDLVEDIKKKKNKKERIQRDIVNIEVMLTQVKDELERLVSLLQEMTIFKERETRELEGLLERFLGKDYILEESFIREKIDEEKRKLEEAFNELERERSIKTFQLAEKKDSFNRDYANLEELRLQFSTSIEEFNRRERIVRERVLLSNIPWEEFLSRDFLKEAQKLKEDYHEKLDLANRNISVYKTRIETSLVRIRELETEIEGLNKSIDRLLEEERSLRNGLEPRCSKLGCSLDSLFDIEVETQYIQQIRRDYSEASAQFNVLRENLFQYRETLIKRDIDPEKVGLDNLLRKEYEEKIEESKTLDEELSKLSKEIGSLESQLKMAREQLALANDLNSKKKSLERTASYYKIIDEALSENRFPEFLISQIMESIIERASIQLMNLTQGRYRFSLASDNSADIVINDNWFPSQRRKTYSLSGGESFLASISLAIAIAEEIRGKRAVDCLFIDEGFGSLDDNGLDSIVSALAELENSGIMIGVITHNKELASRFPYRIEVEKSENGSIIRGGE